MTRNADIVWDGGLKDGKGTITTQSKALDHLPYSYETRFEGGDGVSPEELIASAHASCFTMAVASGLGEKGITPEEIRTTAAVTMQDLKLTTSALTTTVVAPGADEATVRGGRPGRREELSDLEGARLPRHHPGPHRPGLNVRSGSPPPRRGRYAHTSMVRNANAVWNGGLKEGKGTISTQSGGLKDTPYSFNTRFENGIGVNPEELIAAAHASCFSMALGAQLGERGITPEAIRTQAAVTMENLVLTESALTTTVVAPGADEAKVREAAEAAKVGCPISKALSSLDITLDLTVQV